MSCTECGTWLCECVTHEVTRLKADLAAAQAEVERQKGLIARIIAIATKEGEELHQLSEHPGETHPCCSRSVR